MNTTQKYTSDIKDVDNMTGLEFEEFCCELLKQNGYTNVEKTQASGDYGLDVIATSKDGFVCGIQCKNYQGSVGVAAVQEAGLGSQYYKCDIAIVLTNSKFTKQAFELASQTKVKLWDRSKLKELLQVFPEKEVVEEKAKDYSEIETAQELPNVLSEKEIVQKNEFDITDISDISCVDNMTKKEFYIFSRTLLQKYNFTDISKKIMCDEKTFCMTAMKNKTKYLVLCRLSNDLVGKKTVKLSDLKRNECGCRSSIVLTNNFFTESAIQAANQKSTKLWDRNKIIKSLDFFQKRELQSEWQQTGFSNKISRQNINSVDSDMSLIGCLVAIVIIGFIIWRFSKFLIPVLAIILICILMSLGRK